MFIFLKKWALQTCFDALLGRVHVIIGSLVRLILHPACPPQPAADDCMQNEIKKPRDQTEVQRIEIPKAVVRFVDKSTTKQVYRT